LYFQSPCQQHSNDIENFSSPEGEEAIHLLVTPCIIFLRVYNISRKSSLKNGGALVSTGVNEAKVAGRGAAGHVKSGTIIIANDNYDYAMAA
jgi:hypothetical protein